MSSQWWCPQQIIHPQQYARPPVLPLHQQAILLLLPTVILSLLTMALCPNGRHEQPFQEGRLFIPDHGKDKMMSVEPYQHMVRHITGPNPQDNIQSPISQSDPLFSRWEMCATSAGQVYFVNYSTNMTTWEDLWLHSNLDSNMPQNKHDFCSKLLHDFHCILLDNGQIMDNFAHVDHEYVGYYRYTYIPLILLFTT